MQPTAQLEKSDMPARDDLADYDRKIARLIQQLQRDNDTIAQLMEARQRVRRELLSAQERKLLALRGSHDEANAGQGRA